VRTSGASSSARNRIRSRGPVGCWKYLLDSAKVCVPGTQTFTGLYGQMLLMIPETRFPEIDHSRNRPFPKPQNRNRPPRSHFPEAQFKFSGDSRDRITAGGWRASPPSPRIADGASSSGRALFETSARQHARRFRSNVSVQTRRSP